MDWVVSSIYVLANLWDPNVAAEHGLRAGAARVAYGLGPWRKHALGLRSRV